MSDKQIRDYGEPWYWDVDEGIAYDRTKGWAPSLHGNGSRLVQCLNACVGLGDPAAYIAKLREENAAMREAIREAHEAIELISDVGREYYDMDMGPNGANALAYCEEVLSKFQPFLKP